MGEKKLNSTEINTMPKFGDWVPRKVVKDFFGYGNTKMASFATDYNISISKVGKRIFYKYSDVLRLIDEGIDNDSYK